MWRRRMATVLDLLVCVLLASISCAIAANPAPATSNQDMQRARDISGRISHLHDVVSDAVSSLQSRTAEVAAMAQAMSNADKSSNQTQKAELDKAMADLGDRQRLVTSVQQDMLDLQNELAKLVRPSATLTMDQIKHMAPPAERQPPPAPPGAGPVVSQDATPEYKDNLKLETFDAAPTTTTAASASAGVANAPDVSNKFLLSADFYHAKGTTASARSGDVVDSPDIYFHLLEDGTVAGVAHYKASDRYPASTVKVSGIWEAEMLEYKENFHDRLFLFKGRVNHNMKDPQRITGDYVFGKRGHGLFDYHIETIPEDDYMQMIRDNPTSTNSIGATARSTREARLAGAQVPQKDDVGDGVDHGADGNRDGPDGFPPTKSKSDASKDFWDITEGEEDSPKAGSSGGPTPIVSHPQQTSVAVPQQHKWKHFLPPDEDIELPDPEASELAAEAADEQPELNLPPVGDAGMAQHSVFADVMKHPHDLQAVDVFTPGYYVVSRGRMNTPRSAPRRGVPQVMLALHDDGSVSGVSYYAANNFHPAAQLKLTGDWGQLSIQYMENYFGQLFTFTGVLKGRKSLLKGTYSWELGQGGKFVFEIKRVKLTTSMDHDVGQTLLERVKGMMALQDGAAPAGDDGTSGKTVTELVAESKLLMGDMSSFVKAKAKPETSEILETLETEVHDHH